MSTRFSDAPGGPGANPRWASSRKDAVGTAASQRSRVWFTVADGVLTEVFYPRADQANIRELVFVVTDGEDYFSGERCDTETAVETIASGVLGYRVANTSRDGRYRIAKTILTDPASDVLLQHVSFDALSGRGGLRLFAVLEPHIANRGAGNTGWSGNYNGRPMLFAQRGPCALALASTAPFAATSCGFVGVNDGWRQLERHKRLVEYHDRATDGNVALTAEIDLRGSDGGFVMALGFGETPAAAGQAARAALLRDFDAVRRDFVAGWSTFHDAARDDRHEPPLDEECRVSVAVLHAHEDKTHAGGVIASLTVPWGESHGDDDSGGYHVVWPRDLVEIAGAFLAARQPAAALRILHYLMATQDADGHWPQNMWLDGTAWWSGTQLDETGLPVLLADQLRRHDALGDTRPWPMVRRAAGYLVANGPVTPEGRWEGDGGYSTFTLAVEIAALVAAARFADDEGDARVAAYLRETADAWNASIERWTYRAATPLARAAGAAGYYVGRARTSSEPETVSPDAVALVRLGLRSAHDPRIIDTVRVIDHALRCDTATGPVWHRYTGDEYGEYDDGSPFDGSGVGRGWPLLAGERGHYELARGDADAALELLGVMRRQSGPGGLLPEQVWDAADLPRLDLYSGRPSGSAMPLAWAHAEYLKLARSLAAGRVFDLPPETMRRYATQDRESPLGIWRFNNKIRSLSAGQVLRIETRAAAIVRWSPDAWRTVLQTDTHDTSLGVWIADLDTRSLSPGSDVRFTFQWPEASRWEGTDFVVVITPA